MSSFSSLCRGSPQIPNLAALEMNYRAALTQPQLPFWALVSFGAYLLFKLGMGVFTFNDVPKAHAELMGEIEVARKDLRKLGVDVD